MAAATATLPGNADHPDLVDHTNAVAQVDGDCSAVVVAAAPAAVAEVDDGAVRIRSVAPVPDAVVTAAAVTPSSGCAGSDKLFKCNQCEYATRKKWNLDAHVRVHTGEKPYVCPHCEYRCADHSTFSRHQRVHSDDKPFACQHCDYRTRLRSSLVVHELTHTGEKPFACQHCDYRTRQKSSLVAHERKHTGEKPFACELCDYRGR